MLIRALLIALLSLSGHSLARAQNLATNPEFDSDIAAWDCEQSAAGSAVEPADRPEVQCSWSDDDAEGLAFSGSGEVHLDGFSDTLIRAQIVQCIPITPLETYAISAFLRTIANNGRNGQLDIRWHSGSDCTGSSLRLDIVQSVPAPASWTPVQATLSAPAGAGSLKFTVIAFALTDEEHTVRVDGVTVPEVADWRIAAFGLAVIGWRRGRTRRPLAASARGT